MNDYSGYKMAHEKAAFYRIPESGFYRLSGTDRVDFLQRQTTNDITNLTANGAIMTVLTSAKARIQDVFWLIDEGETIGLMALPGRGTATFEFLRGRIFFNDQVSLSDHSPEYCQLLLEGPQAAEGLAALGLPRLGLAKVGRGSGSEIPIVAIAQTGLSGIGYRLLAPETQFESIVGILRQAGLNALSQQEYEILRVEAGLPGENSELTADYTPLEMGLLDLAISQTKGCYTGQEVIARQVNFDKITRSLVGLRLDAPVQVSESVSSNGKPVGKVTSVAHSPRFGDIALAVLKRPFEKAGTKVNLGENQAVVSALPF
jgi:tRNA-modifying protein YgfZ